MITDNIVVWETRLSRVVWVYSKTHFAGDLWIGVDDPSESIGATLNHITKNLMDEFSSKSVLCHLTKGRRRGGFVIL